MRCSVSGEMHCNIGSKRAFPTSVIDVWHNCLLYLLTHKLFSSCIQRHLVSRACDWVMPALSDVLLTFSFQFSLLFLHVKSQPAAAAYVVYPISDIGHCQKCGKYVPCTWHTAQGKDFELILMITRRLHCVEWTQYSICPKRSAICNRCFHPSSQHKWYPDRFRSFCRAH